MIKLYSRNDCPLCEDIENALIALNIKYQYIDIDLDESIRKKYHVKIPVLENMLMQELTFPFDNIELVEFSRQ